MEVEELTRVAASRSLISRRYKTQIVSVPEWAGRCGKTTVYVGVTPGILAASIAASIA
jgi:hypothetical protein